MRKIIADIHTHTIASGHAYGTIREMAQAAALKKLKILGLTEHAPGIPGTTDPFYYMNLEVVPRELYGVSILHGCEINVLNDGTLSLEERFIKKLDYAIVGIHSLWGLHQRSAAVDRRRGLYDHAGGTGKTGSGDLYCEIHQR